MDTWIQPTYNIIHHPYSLLRIGLIYCHRGTNTYQYTSKSGMHSNYVKLTMKDIAVVVIFTSMIDSVLMKDLYPQCLGSILRIRITEDILYSCSDFSCLISRVLDTAESCECSSSPVTTKNLPSPTFSAPR